MKPFLKWAGNKFQIIDKIKSALGSGRKLIEPFTGSGAVFLNTDFEDYYLSDANPDLINLFQHLQTEGDRFIEFCRSFFTPENNDKEVFYQLRTLFNVTDDSRLKSALFVYLNRHCFNGLCRYNLKNQFNVPFGKYAKPYFPEKEMSFFAKKSKYAIFEVADFEKTMESARPGDVIYCDPPYVPLSETASFTSYSSGGFGVEEQLRLARCAEKMQQQGVRVIISNHYTPFTEKEYSKARLDSFDVKRFISANASKRNPAKEILAVFE